MIVSSSSPTEFRDRAMREVTGTPAPPASWPTSAASYRLFLEWARTVGEDLDPTAADKEHWKWLCTSLPTRLNSRRRQTTPSGGGTWYTRR